jgi:hypothetical protein
VDVKLGDHTLVITAIKVDNGDGKAPKTVDAIRFLFSTNWLPRHTIQFFHKDSDSSDALAVRWHLWKIVEYVDNSTAAGFDPDSDSVVSDFKFFKASWTKLQSSKLTGDDGTDIHQICTSVVGNSPSVTLCLFLAAGSTNFHGIAHDPNAVKWSLTIANYPYVKTDSRLALKFSFASRMKIKDFDSQDDKDFGKGNDEDAVVAGDDGNGSNKGLASYVKSINVTGTNCAATGSVKRTIIREGEWSLDIDADLPDEPSTEDDTKISFDKIRRVGYFSFITDCQPTSIEWDPQFGVGQTDDGSSAGIAILPSLLLAVIALFAALL